MATTTCPASTLRTKPVCGHGTSGNCRARNYRSTLFSFKAFKVSTHRITTGSSPSLRFCYSSDKILEINKYYALGNPRDGVSLKASKQWVLDYGAYLPGFSDTCRVDETGSNSQLTCYRLDRYIYNGRRTAIPVVPRKAMDLDLGVFHLWCELGQAGCDDRGRTG